MSQQYRPDRFEDQRYYHPSQHGAEREIYQRMMVQSTEGKSETEEDQAEIGRRMMDRKTDTNDSEES